MLAETGADIARFDGVTVQERVTFGHGGSVVGRLHHPQTMTSWDRLFTALRQAWGHPDYRLEAELYDIRQDANAVVATFANGAIIEADLLVAADGFRSTVRSLFAQDLQPRYAGYVGWRGLIDEAALKEATHRDLFDVFSFCLPRGEQLIGYPVPGPGNDLRPGHRRTNFVWYRPADAAHLADLLTDAAGTPHLISIAPRLIRPEHVDAMRADAKKLLAPQFVEIIQATAMPFLQPIYDLESERIGWGRIALLGDAAFVVRPHLGAGVTKACEDALTLAIALDQTADIADAVSCYASRRIPAGQALVRRARHLGAALQAHHSNDEERLAAERHHSAKSTMIETASLNFQIEQ